jgi:hypothetical protein
LKLGETLSKERGVAHGRRQDATVTPRQPARRPELSRSISGLLVDCINLHIEVPQVKFHSITSEHTRKG